MIWSLLPIVCSIAAIVLVEYFYRMAKSTNILTVVGARLNYPIWLGVALQSLPGMGWVTWLVLGYCLAIVLVANWVMRLIQVRQEIKDDFRQWKRDFEKSLALSRQIQEQQRYLSEKGCPLGLQCEAMGEHSRGCSNFATCTQNIGLAYRYGLRADPFQEAEVSYDEIFDSLPPERF